ncbi:MAG: hypothetical protein PHC53_04745 [Patescibacteria group bacterium]|nr:hypothetical protein [Patescibacteria group bacterium]
MATYQFDPCHSPLSRSQEKINQLVFELSRRLGHDAKVIGILEMGSFAKHEGLPCSDSDLRVFASSPHVYFDQTRFNSEQEIKNKEKKELEVLKFAQLNGDLPWQMFEWFQFNAPMSTEISDILNLNIEFGVTDSRFTQFNLDKLEEYPSEEHQRLLQSNIIYDPDGTIERWQQKINGVRYQSMCNFYQERYLDKPPSEIYLYLKPSEMDLVKIKKSGQVLWVKWAVRAIRDAVASKTYQATGKFVYLKQDVIEFYQKYLPQHLDFVKQLYIWKTDPTIRAEMVNDFITDSTPFFKEFNNLMPKLEQVVADVNKLEL